MHATLANDPASNFHIKRINLLYENTPSSMLSIVIGVALVVVVMSSGSAADLLKPWVTFMLSVLGLRGCLWLMHRASDQDAQSARRWEFGYAATMFMTGIGWGALSGPLYAASASLQVFILVLTMIVVFSGAVYSSVSQLSFFMFSLPSAVPSLLRYVSTVDESFQLLGWVAAAGGVFVLVTVHETLFRLSIRHLRHEVEIEALLAEQETIFQAVSAGIAVVHDGKVTKCNGRLGEILGRSLKDIQTTPMSAMLVSAVDVETIRAAIVVAQNDGTPFHGTFRMRHADGSEFWADVSARRMTNDRSGDMIWLIGDADRHGRPSGA